MTKRIMPIRIRVNAQISPMIYLLFFYFITPNSSNKSDDQTNFSFWVFSSILKTAAFSATALCLIVLFSSFSSSISIANMRTAKSKSNGRIINVFMFIYLILVCVFNKILYIWALSIIF